MSSERPPCPTKPPPMPFRQSVLTRATRRDSPRAACWGLRPSVSAVMDDAGYLELVLLSLLINLDQ